MKFSQNINLYFHLLRGEATATLIEEWFEAKPCRHIILHDEQGGMNKC